jgi:hypothetical protein
MGDDQAAALADGTHQEHEDHPWTIVIPDHPPRSDSPEYKHSRATMNRIARNVDGFYYGQAPYQDHHGGGLWLLDDDGWFLVRNLAGIEWASQFCADPAKVDKLRVNARRIYAGFPKAVAALGIRELLDTPITDAAGVARWTDSICNTSVPLTAELQKLFEEATGEARKRIEAALEKVTAAEATVRTLVTQFETDLSATVQADAPTLKADVEALGKKLVADVLAALAVGA